MTLYRISSDYYWFFCNWLGNLDGPCLRLENTVLFCCSEVEVLYSWCCLSGHIGTFLRFSEDYLAEETPESFLHATLDWNPRVYKNWSLDRFPQSSQGTSCFPLCNYSAIFLITTKVPWNLLAAFSPPKCLWAARLAFVWYISGYLHRCWDWVWALGF